MARQVHALQALAGVAPDLDRIGGVVVHRLVTRGDAEIGIAQLDAKGACHIALALQVGRYLLAQARENLPQFGLVMDCVQVAVKRGFAADADRLAVRHHRAVVAAPGGFVQPVAVALSKLLHQPERIARRQLANRLDAVLLQLGTGLGSDPLDLAAGQRPDQRLQIALVHDADAIRLVELACHLGQQLVRRHADRAGQAGGVQDAAPDALGQHAAAVQLAIRHLGEIDIDLVDAAVLHHRGDAGDDGLEASRKIPVALKIGRQQDCVRAEPCRLHQAHGRTDAKLACRVGGGGDDAAPGIAAQARELFQRNLVQPAGPGQLQRVVRVVAAAADDHGQITQLRVAQQFDRGKERIHVQMRDAPVAGRGRSALRTHLGDAVRGRR